MSKLPGNYEIRCSCGQWNFTGTPAEIAAATRTLDGGAHRGHVMAIAHTRAMAALGQIANGDNAGCDSPQEFAAAVLDDIAALDAPKADL